MLSPRVPCCGAPRLMFTRHRWRRSTSFLLAEKTTNDLSDERAALSTSNSPGVRAVSAPPSEEIEYRCAQPSLSEGNKRRLPAAHCQKSSPCKPGKVSLSVSPDRQICLPSPLFASATQIAQGCKRSRSFEKVSFTLKRRMKAMRRPSGAKSGALCRYTYGEPK